MQGQETDAHRSYRALQRPHPEQKTACARAVVEAIQTHLNAPPEATQVIFVDVEKSDWLTGNKIPPLPK